MSRYNSTFYQFLESSSGASARALVPHVVEMLHPQTVLDVGCGTGEWLKVFAEAGIGDVLGVDGPWVNTNSLRISANRFRSVDLRQPIHLDRRFDLVMSLEVAEHVPAKSADSFIESLVRHGDIVLFSAAIPGQGGTYHVNEQWPEYWAERFRARGYVGIDCIRPRVWNAPNIAFWYAQNTFLFVRDSALASNEALCVEADRYGTEVRAIVHPKLWESRSSLRGSIIASLNRYRDRLRRLGT